MFTAGRYEYRNKGVDMFIESLARLNYRLKAANSNLTVVAFIIMPAATHSYTVEALKGQAVTKQLKDTVEQIQQRIGDKLFERTARYTGEGGMDIIDPATLLSEQDRLLHIECQPAHIIRMRASGEVCRIRKRQPAYRTR